MNKQNYTRALALLFVFSVGGCSGNLNDNDAGGAGNGGGTQPGGPNSPSQPTVKDPPAEGACSNPLRDPGPLVARRLTRWEYVNSVKDVLGIDLSQEIKDYPRELRTEGFFNTAKDLLPTLDRVTLWNELARKASEKVADLNGFVGKYTSCRDATAACQKEFISRLGAALARRPLSDAEVDRFLPIFAATDSCKLGFEAGGKAVLQALLQSPQFLYRAERQKGAEQGTFRALDGYEMASRLSYLVAGTSPDQALFDAAKSGALADPNNRAKQSAKADWHAPGESYGTSLSGRLADPG